uniref:Tf2-1-like SH3-like domain-containing protein n=1 Tax=Tanacetum cinerariifolium TaxID=118510 RepID=A0A699GYR4_TANCI|nr:hypothetical protein [Tanacetum cinerariifolium]
MPDAYAVAVSGVSRAKTHVHTHAPGESEAQNGLPDLPLLCPDAVLNEKKKVELYIKGLSEIIKAKNERIAKGLKRKWENNNQGNNNNNHNRDLLLSVTNAEDAILINALQSVKIVKEWDTRPKTAEAGMWLQAWSACVNYLGHRQSVYIKILGDITKSLGNPTKFEHRLLPRDGWSKRENDSDAGRHGIIRFVKRGKLSPQYIGPFEIIERIGPMAYKLELPEKLRGIHNTFHVSNLKKCLADENLVIPLEEVQLDDKLHFIKEPVEIMDREVKQLKQIRIPIVKVR